MVIFLRLKAVSRALISRYVPVRLLFSLISLSLVLPAIADEQSKVILKNNQWMVIINPSTLAIEAKFSNKSASVLDYGIEKKVVTNFSQASSKDASWKWSASAITVSAHLNNDDLKLSFTAKVPQTFTWMQQPSDKLRKGMVWPLGEGIYVPSHSQLFNRYLTSECVGTVNTTQDLSLPLWESDYGHYSYSWLLLTPWNNTINFKNIDHQLLVSAKHIFTPMNLKQPFTVMLHLDMTWDKLAGAKRYRQWLKHTDQFVSLKSKLKHAPQGEKLLGAPQIYLWGGELLSPGNVKNWSGLIHALNHPEKSGLAALVAKMDQNTLQTIKKTSEERIYPFQKYVIIEGINAAIAKLKPFSKIADSNSYISDMQKAITLQKNTLFTLLKPYVLSEQLWGDGLSIAVINKLHHAGLTRLWLGLPDWRAAMAHPEAVSLAKKDGYIVAIYDSYNTALSPASNMEWLTAHMGAKIYNTCYIKSYTAHIQKGFKNHGRYVSPACVMPYFEQRTDTLQKDLHLNGWFLDVDATGKVDENYQTAYKGSQYDDAIQRGKRLRYLEKKYQLIIGSEGGHAIEAANIFFGQGIDAPVFAWGNKAMFYNRHSRFFRGTYWPTSQPTLFFKSIPLQKEFAQVMFNPKYRVPLFQAVFHDSEITTFHWFNGLLKYKGVAAEREITQMLYAQPPLYHLNAATASQRIKEIKYANKFFQPVGAQLATRALIHFKWLNKERTLQETVFSDNTKLFANFGKQTQYIHKHVMQPMSLLEIESDGKTHYFKSKLS